jgi:hypothetical protein
MALKTKVCIISTLILMAACVLAMYISRDLARKEVARKGVELVTAINALNRELEPRGLGNVWPRAEWPYQKLFEDRDHIFDKAFTNAESYFEFLLDGTRIGQSDWRPYVEGIDYSHLGGAGVPIKRGGGKLSGTNVMWCILADFGPEQEDITPVLVTRNVDVDLLAAAMRGRILPNDKTPVTLGGDFATPFGDKTAIIVTGTGKVLILEGKNLTLGACFDNKRYGMVVGAHRIPRYLKPNK